MCPVTLYKPINVQGVPVWLVMNYRTFWRYSDDVLFNIWTSVEWQ